MDICIIYRQFRCVYPSEIAIASHQQLQDLLKILNQDIDGITEVLQKMTQKQERRKKIKRKVLARISRLRTLVERQIAKNDQNEKE